MNPARVLVFAVAAILILGTAQIASADSMNLGATNWNAKETFTTSGGTSGTWSLTFDFVNGTANTVDVNSFAVQLFNSGATESFSFSTATLNGGALGVWEFFADDKLNNGGTPDCSSTSVKGWLCGDTGHVTLNPFSIASGKTLEFILGGTYANTSAINQLDLMASGCLVAGTCKLDGGSDNTNRWTVSGAMTVPEPSSLVLLAGGLSLVSLLGMVLRRAGS
jgi:hypothetical protein